MNGRLVEMDFNPLKQIIADQEKQIEEYEERIADLERQLTDMVVTCDELESSKEDLIDALSDVRDIIGRHV